MVRGAFRQFRAGGIAGTVTIETLDVEPERPTYEQQLKMFTDERASA